MFRSAKDITNIVPKEYDLDDADCEHLNCDLCSEGGWMSDTELAIHRGVSHTEKISEIVNKDPNYCRICLLNCKTSDELLKHIKTDHLYSSETSIRVQREVFICDWCLQIFFNKDLLLVHIVHIHLKNKVNTSRIKCPKCPKHINIKTIWSHLQGHGVQSVSTCPVCLTKCRNRKHLMMHMKIHPRYLKCNMCLYETKREDLFQQHILTKHKSTDQNTNTMNANKYFVPTVELTWKYRRLTGLQGLELTNGVHVCIFCREICVGENSMNKHIQVDHNLKEVTIKPMHVCTCGLVFTNKVLLKHHTFKMKGNHKMMDPRPKEPCDQRLVK